MARGGVTFRGFREVDRALATFPAKTAEALQGTLVRQLIEAKKRIAATSTMSPFAKRAIRAKKGIVRIIPDHRVSPRRLKDVEAELFSVWRGGLPIREGAAKAIEAQVGTRVYRPRTKRGLLIPAGINITKTGRIKRKGGRKVDPAKQPGARFIRTKRGVLLIRDVAGTRRGRKARTEILAVLAKKAKPTARLTFFDSWESLEGKRTRQYGKMLDRLIARF